VGWSLTRGVSNRLEVLEKHRELPQRPLSKTNFWHILGPQNTSGKQKNAIFLPSVMRKINICVRDLNISNVSDCIKDNEAIIYQGLWGTGPLNFIRGYSSFVWGGGGAGLRSPPGPIAGYGSGCTYEKVLCATKNVGSTFTSVS